MSFKETKRLKEIENGEKGWRKWGPYLSERAWGTVREDYRHGTAWEHVSHDAARSKAFRWSEDGIAGISDDMQNICFALSLWNHRDPILKERLFGLTGNEGNHGEDVKEYYYYLDNTPSHSYMKYLYKYPQAEFPYAKLVSENGRRGRDEPEYELIDTGVFDENRYFDVEVEYAKNSPEEIFIFITVSNRGPEAAKLTILPTLWFRNRWSWRNGTKKPLVKQLSESCCGIKNAAAGDYNFCSESDVEFIFTENETDYQSLHGLITGAPESVNPDKKGTKVAAVIKESFESGQSKTFRFMLSDNKNSLDIKKADKLLQTRKKEADEFYENIGPKNISAEEKKLLRQSLSGLLWTKQFYYYDVAEWLKGDPKMPSPPAGRMHGRNKSWEHLNNADIISMPDKWEYPWYATWDLAFHCVPFTMVDPHFAKEQLILMCREWYMHPNGQLPAYEWSFDDVNPPVHAWAALEVFKMERECWGNSDYAFLEKVFHKLLLNFTWWVNRKDEEGMNIFQGGFLGLDNIGVFDRSNELPTGGHIEQSDGTSWMAMYCLNMLSISMELARNNPVYQDMATKFFEHFLYIANAMNNMGHEGVPLWDDEDGFFYDVLHVHGEKPYHMKIRSLVGLVPLFAVSVFDQELLDELPEFKVRMEWFLENRKDLCKNVACMRDTGVKGKGLLSIIRRDKLEKILSKLLSEEEFLSPYGIRALSKYHKENPFIYNHNGQEHRVDYEPAESRSGLFGGNSNWRGPIWFPMNYLLIESLKKYHDYFGDTLKVDCPTGSGKSRALDNVGTELSKRLISIFLPDKSGRKPMFGDSQKFQNDEHFKNHILFYEYFNGDDGAGVGASHQTGWTSLVANLIRKAAQK